ncbi:MAG TPA: hypothetical protein EYP14_12735 [Planctomycetaceae bacterium]|nr:hypothetical protein [Planctomycetaceae bacterium]
MPIRYKCRKCGVTLKIKDELAGKQGKCPKCRTAFRIPKPETAAVGPSASGPADRPRISAEEEEAFRHLTEELGEGPAAKKRKPQPAVSRDPESPHEHDDEYFRANPTAAADVAGELLALTGKKSQKTDWRAALKKPFTPTKAAQAYREYVWHVTQRVVLTIVVGGVIVGGAWWVSTRLMGTSSDLPDLGLVTGVVTLDGQPLPRATVEFHPIAPPGEQAPGSASIGRTDDSGLYELKYLKNVYGAVVGKHRIVITPHASSRVLLPSEYNVRSKLIREVKPGKNVINFQLRSKL